MQYVARAVWLTQQERVQRQFGSTGPPGSSNLAAALAAIAGGGEWGGMGTAAGVLPRQGRAEGSNNGMRERNVA